MRKFIHREDQSDDSLSAEQRTVIFKKDRQDSIDSPVFTIEQNDESQFTKLIQSESSTKPTSGTAFAMEKLRQSIANSRRAREHLTARVSEKTKTVETARQTLQTNQQKLKTLLEQTGNKAAKPKTGTSTGNMNSALHVLQQQFELMDLDQKTMEDKITLESLESMEDMIRKISHKINNALDFMQNAPLAIGPHDVLTLIKETLLGVNMPYGVDLDLPPNTDAIQCDSEKIKSVFRNILVNAIEAMDECGKITVKITGELYHCIVEISNTGPKIPNENMEKIFEPLFSTKENGNGLGLARCKEIIQRHGGQISAHNNPTRFVIKLVRTQ